MRGTKAKQLRREAYGSTKEPMPRRYFLAKDRSLRLSGPRAAYQRAKRLEKNETAAKVEALPRSQWHRRPVQNEKTTPSPAPAPLEKKKQGLFARLKALIKKILRKE